LIQLQIDYITKRRTYFDNETMTLCSFGSRFVQHL